MICSKTLARRLSAAAITCAIWLSTVDAAEQPIEEVVVLGEFRESRLMDSPRSVSVVRPNEGPSTTVHHLEQVLGRAPNVNFASGGSRARFYQIRGIGERGQFAEPLNSSVGLTVDGVDLSGIGIAASLFDVAQVEVLRGPQGTLYGANAMAGLINVITHDPTDELMVRARAGVADFDSRDLGLVVSGPLTRNLGGRLAVQHYRDDGFSRNAFLDRDDTEERDELTARGKLEFEANDRQTWIFTGGWVDVDNGYDAFSFDNSRTRLSDEPGHDRQETAYGSARLQHSLSSGVDLIASVGGAASDIDYAFDEDWAFTGFHPDGFTSFDRYRRDRSTVTLDARLVSTPQGGLFRGRTDWVAGIYGLTQSVDLERNYTFLAEDFFSEFDIDRVAVYGELTHSLNDRFRVTLGLRGERHESRYQDSNGVRFSPTDHLIGGRLVGELDIGRNAMGYASATRGYKAGGFNTSGTLAADLREFDPESLWNFELGLKAHGLEGRLDARVALFHMLRDDVQVSTSIIRTRDDGTAEFIDLIDNAAQGRNSGIELEFGYQATPWLRLFANAGWLDTEFDDFVNTAGEDLDGEEQAHAPDYQVFAGVEAGGAAGWFARVELEGKGSFFFSNSRRFVEDIDQVRSDSYTLLNASAGYRASSWDVTVWGRNLTDVDYRTRGFFFGNDPRDGFTPRGFFQWGEPQRVGVTVNFALVQ